jgi:hypothetical protein
MKFKFPALSRLPALLCACAVNASFADAAFAQTCTEDADCAPEEYCDQAPSSGAGSSGSDGSATDSEPCAPGDPCTSTDPAEPPPSEETIEEPTEGECERGGRTCTSDDDCLADHYCALDDFDAACSSDSDCSDVESTSTTGVCMHEPYTCETDADCPEPTVCGEEGECTFELTVCETNADCDARYECISIRGGGSDSASVDDSAEPPMSAGDPKASSSASSPGENTDDAGASESTDDASREAAEAAAAEAEASSSDPDEPDSICFPEAAPCETDADCSDGWVCGEVDGAPPSWGDIEWSCLPPGIVAVFDGDIDVEGGGNDSSGDGSAETPREDGESGEEPVGDDDTDVVEALGTQGGSEGSEGCRMGTAPRSGGGLGWIAAALGLVAFTRRRPGTPRY